MKFALNLSSRFPPVMVGLGQESDREGEVVSWEAALSALDVSR